MGNQNDLKKTKMFWDQLDSVIWRETPYRIILTHLADHQCLKTKIRRDPPKVGLFTVNQKVGLIK